MPLAAAIPLVIVLLMLGLAGSSYSAPTDNEGSVIMSRQGIFSGIDTTTPPADAVTDISVSLPGFGVSTSFGSAPAVSESTSVSAPITSVIDTLRPQDITANSATLRGQVKGLVTDTPDQVVTPDWKALRMSIGAWTKWHMIKKS